MEIKDYKCKCGHSDFFFKDKGNQRGIYCSYCGKWLKWADKDERNLSIGQESTSEQKDRLDDAKGVSGEVRARTGMTEEERKIALYCLKANSDYHREVCEECVNYPNCDHTIQDDVTETIIKALEQELCDNAEVKKIDEWEINGKNAELWIVRGKLQIRYLGTIHNIPLPFVTPQAKTGRWIESTGQDDIGHFYTCSECGRYINLTCGAKLADYPYCHCGAKMEVEK